MVRDGKSRQSCQKNILNVSIQKNKTMKNEKPIYVIYARKSTESKERQILSIDSQIQELKGVAKRRDIKVEEILTESKSAKKPGRPVFSNMMARILDNKIKGVLCWKPDRLARNPIDSGSILWALKQNNLEIITPSQSYSRDDDNSILMNLEFGMAQKYIDDLSKNVKRGQKMKVEMGWLPGVAPLGYLNTKSNEKGANTLKKDEERFTLMRKMFDLMLTGAYTPPQILEIANKEWGFRTRPMKHQGSKPLTRSMIYRIFTNPFYYGLFRYGGGEYKGKHETMITEEEFWRIQELLGRKGQPRPKTRRWFKYVGPVRCGSCGAAVTAEERTKRQKNGNVHTYVYYHCTKQKRPRCTEPLIEEKKLEEEIDRIVSELEISPAFRDWAFAKIREENGREAEQREAITVSQRKAYDDCVKKIDGLIDMRAAQEIDENEFKTKKAELLKDKARLEKLLESTDAGIDRWVTQVEKEFDFATNARARFAVASPDEKREFVAALAEDSNLLLVSKMLRLSDNNRYSVLQKKLKDQPSVKPGFEPPETSEGRPLLSDLYDQNPTLRKGRDSNPRCR